jgi:ribosomal protein S18 acetylase RimI-like enzyme
MKLQCAMEADLVIRQMTRSEAAQLIDWAADEGWNPGLHDGEVFWHTDPDAFIAAELKGELVGGGTITSYAGAFGFMGFFIVRPAFRGRGLGHALWQARRDRLLGRLQAGASIGMDGVFDMQAYYARGGFEFSHRDIRFRADIPADVAAPAADPGIVELSQLDFDDVLVYDRSCFPTERARFLQAWTGQPDTRALGCVRDGRLVGYGVVRRCREGCKIGPLFADDAATAMALFAPLSAFAAGGAIFLDVPENNPAAIALAKHHDMREVFGCARMYLGPAPELMHSRVFGVTTFELG